MFPVVKPHLSEAGVVVVDHAAGAAGERVRRGLAEHVAHVRAWRDLECAAAHPYLPRRYVIAMAIWLFIDKRVCVERGDKAYVFYRFLKIFNYIE